MLAQKLTVILEPVRGWQSWPKQANARLGYIITENYYLSSEEEEVLLFSIGGRRMVKRVGIDFALITSSDTGGELIAFPILGISVPFGKVPGNLYR